MSPTRWDARILLRAAAATGLALGLVWLVTAATDEGDVSWGDRAGRALPLTPVCAAIGAWVALAPVRARGETLALAALGRSRIQVVAGAVAGGALVAFAAAIAVGLVSAVDAAAFFPRAAHTSAWIWHDGSFVDLTRALAVDPSGAPLPLSAKTWAVAATIPKHGRGAAAIAIAVAGLALPLLLAYRLASGHQGGPRQKGAGRSARKSEVLALLASAGAVAGSIVLFQAAAAGLVPALVGVVPPVLLLAFAVERYRKSP